jgi:hypothetical protein
MKPFLLILFARCLVLHAAAADISLYWDYPTNDLSTQMVFKVYWTTNITNPVIWQSFIVPGTTTTTRVTMEPGRRFFVMTASNLWGESELSNLISTPNPATNVTGLKITKP